MSKQSNRTGSAAKPGPWMSRLNKFSKNLAIVVAVITALSTIAGVAWNVYEDARSTYEARKSQQLSQLTTYADFGEVVKRYREIGSLAADYARTISGMEWNCDSLLAEYGNGNGIYYCRDFAEYREVREFYEDLGILVRYGAVDFDLVYDVVIFPDDFVDETRGLTECIRENWYGRGKGVPGFSSNFRELEKNYERKRKGETPVWTSPGDD